VARKLAFNIREFTSHGFHGKFFVGPSTFDIHRDAFVVLELENLKVQPDLYRVVTLLVINAVTQDLYLSDRFPPRLIIFDEAWQFLGKAAMLAPVINEGYRRARKYNGSFMIITQSILDLDNFGEVGRVINGNSAFKIYLESSDFDQARKRGLIDYDDFTIHCSKASNPTRPNTRRSFSIPLWPRRGPAGGQRLRLFHLHLQAHRDRRHRDHGQGGRSPIMRRSWRWLSGGLVEELRARALAVDLAAIRQEAGRYQPASLHQLPRARVSRRFAVDMTYTLEQELRDGEGRVLYPQGFTFNPLEYVSLSGGLVVIDGGDAEQVAWFKASPYS
jgi:hypothetical protein